MWFIYELLLVIGFLAYLPKALWRKRLPHRGWSMRIGRYPPELVDWLGGRRSIWVHAVSVGEVQAARPLLQALAKAAPQMPLALSTITASGFQVASKAVEGIGVAVYFPLDLRRYVLCALRTFNPKVLILVESELWPVSVHLTRARGTPIAVVNGRVSSRAFRRAVWIKLLFARMLQGVNLFLMQSQTDADRIIQLGAPANRVQVVGSLKWDASVSARPTVQEIQATTVQLGLASHTPVIVAGSTHRGEEEAILKAFQALKVSHPAVRLVIAPRHVERLDEVEVIVRKAGLMPKRVSASALTHPSDVGIVDTFGQMPRYYGVATIVFIGGSLIPHGGQNPLEAASLGKPIVFGPFMHNFEAIVHQLLAHHAARQVTAGDELAALFQELLANPAQAQAMGKRAQELTERFQGATQRTLDALKPVLS